MKIIINFYPLLNYKNILIRQKPIYQIGKKFIHIIPYSLLPSKTILFKPTEYVISKRHMRRATQKSILSIWPLISQNSRIHQNQTLKKIMEDRYETNLNGYDLFPEKYRNFYSPIENKIIPINAIAKKILPYHTKPSILESKQDQFIFKENPTIFPLKKLHVSGIYQASPTWFTENIEQHKLFVTHMILKFNFCMFSGEPIKNYSDICDRIVLFLQKDNMLDDPIYYPIAQHILCNVFTHFKFPLSVLKNFALKNNINYKFYEGKEISINLIIETIVFDITLSDMIKNKKLGVVAQNPDNPLGDHIQYASQCYIQMKQPYADFRIHDVKTSKTWFYDVKLINDPYNRLSLTKGFLSLVTSTNDNNKMHYIKRFRGDIKGQANNNVHIDKNTKKEIIPLHKNVDNLVKVNNKSVNDKILQLENMQNNFDLNKNVEHIICSRISIPETNKSFENFIQNHYIIMQKNLTMQSSQIILEKYFPQNDQTANILLWHALILDILKQMPKEMQKNLENNYHKFKLIEYQYYNHDQ